jgi:hypothetical protein
MIIIYFREEPTSRKYTEKDTDIEQRFVNKIPYSVCSSTSEFLNNACQGLHIEERLDFDG